MTRLLSTVAALAAAGVLVAGCGSDDSSAGGGGGGGDYGGGAAPAKTTAPTSATPAPAAGGSSLTLAPDESNGLAFDKKALTAKAGTVTITMDNPSSDSLPHAVAVEGPGGVDEDGPVAQPGGTSKVSLDLKPGTYTFYCPVGSHRSAGMEGTLTVR
ncbi:MAG TPA: plastocyanin/azurin family copper-binding protein [Baekduia sp.]|nr:plastocyanin/azurin family copper-binding protein [Baekduia sp.]